MAGYVLENLSALDAFLRSMLLGGMGPVASRTTAASFAGFFALYAGLVFIATAALLLGPCSSPAAPFSLGPE